MSALTPADEARLEAERALAAKLFPREWAAALAMPGKRGGNCRTGLRKRAVNEEKLIPLRAAGACCQNCGHYGTTTSFGPKPRRHCSLDSDFYGYAITKPTDLCSRWEEVGAPGRRGFGRLPSPAPGEK